MYANHAITGQHLPPKTLCLTYDDGPGEHTLPIALFLHQLGIRATFFVVGKYAVEQPEVLARLAGLGHLIGNHTYDHPDLPYYVSVNGDVQNQVLRTQAIIRSATKQPVFFRAPYGKWSMEVANELNTNPLCTLGCTGPIHWEVGGIDCYYWLQGKTVDEAVDSYQTAIAEAGSGIVVMHDDVSDMDTVKPLNQTLALTRQLIPLLLADGYRFVGLDEVVIPDAAALEVYLAVGSKRFVSLRGGVGPQLAITAAAAKTPFAMVPCPNGKIALRTPAGTYWQLLPHNLVETTATAVHPQSEFDLVPLFDNRFVLRTHSGNFINIDAATGTLTATAAYMRLATIFSCFPVHHPVSKPISFSMQLQLWKKRLAFVRSKLLSR